MVTTKTFADELQINRTTVTQWIREGRIPAVKLPRTWAILSEILDHIRENGVPARDTHPRPTVHRAE
jgi:excisionase family DNA binding protein